VIDPLDRAMNKAFPESTAAHTQLATALGEGRKPEPHLIDDDREKLATLIFQLQKIRDDIGELLSLQKVRDSLNNIITAQNRIGRFIRDLQRDAVNRALVPDVQPAEITLAKKAKGKVKHAIAWNFFADTLKVSLTPPAAGGIQVPPVVTVGGDDLEYEVVAGDVAGEFIVVVTPTAGKPTRLKVTVK
jgi:hypothetical protein